MDRVAQPAGNLPGQQGTRHFAINAGFDEKDGSDIFPTGACPANGKLNPCQLADILIYSQ